MTESSETGTGSAPAEAPEWPQGTPEGRRVIQLLWEPNLTAAANEDHKGYHALLAAFLARVRGEPSDAPTIEDGVRAMQVLELMTGSL